MSQVIRLDVADIALVEKILLPEGKTFDAQRRDFILNLNTIDLQAVPGSGKTTALLAKLLLLEHKLPFEDDSGVLVLSHTNAAIDEIKSKIQKHCAKLFSYPNFIGTIQSFVDEFLAVPFYLSKFKQKPYRIDNEIYDEQIDRFYNTTRNVGLKNWLDRKNDPIGFLRKLRLDSQGNLISSLGSNANEFELKNKNAPTYTALLSLKVRLLEKGYLHYEDAYILANSMLNKIPVYPMLLQKRFKYVFVDEMQDMDKHQYELLERIFYDEGRSTSKYQRIGDKNQSIYNTVKVDNIWVDREPKLHITGSQRLSPLVAKVVNNFALVNNEEHNIVGLKESNIQPHILLYKNATISRVIPFFIQLINSFRENGELFDLEKYPAKVIAWNTEWKTQVDKDDIAKIRLVDFYGSYSKAKQNPPLDYNCLKAYLKYFNKNAKTLEAIRSNILNSFLKILRLEDIKDDQQRSYTKRKLLGHLKYENPEKYDLLKLKLYQWSIAIIRGNLEGAWNNIKLFAPQFITFFSENGIRNSNNFINDNLEEVIENNEVEQSTSNIFRTDNLEVELTSVHAVKGQTHSATLYLESFYDGQYESMTLAEAFKVKSSHQLISELKEFIGKLELEITVLAGRRGTKTRESKINSCLSQIELISKVTKMAYVGFSRPTSFLCVAIHEDRFEALIRASISDDWKVVEVLNPENPILN